MYKKPPFNYKKVCTTSQSIFFQPFNSVEIRVELLGIRAGGFIKEIWIKTEPLQRVRLLGTFIEPQLEIEHPLETFRLTVVHFPKTYYGARSSKILVIGNHSSRPTMFCTVAESKLETLVCVDFRP